MICYKCYSFLVFFYDLSYNEESHFESITGS